MDLLRRRAWTLHVRGSAACALRRLAVCTQGLRRVRCARRAEGRAKDGAGLLQELRQRLGQCCVGDPATLSGGLLAVSAATSRAAQEDAAANAAARRRAQRGLRTRAAADPATQGRHHGGDWRRLRLQTRIWPVAPAKATAAGHGPGSRDARVALQLQGSRGPAAPRTCGVAAASAASAADVLAALDDAAATARGLGWSAASFRFAELPRGTTCLSSGQTSAADSEGQAHSAAEADKGRSGQGLVPAELDSAAGTLGTGQGAAGLSRAADPRSGGLAAEAAPGSAAAEPPAEGETGAERGWPGPTTASDPRMARRAAEAAPPNAAAQLRYTGPEPCDEGLAVLSQGSQARAEGSQGAEAPLVLPYAALEGAADEPAFAADTRGEGASDTPDVAHVRPHILRN